ncbi:MAG TPA: hypothetical protein VFQ65_32630, partial [Kofleriaceae bacterium]|nr:hypothetical protein [Kofleriaceae bacterium]
MYRACLVAVLLASRSAGADCTVAGTITLSKVTVKTTDGAFEIGVNGATAVVTISGRGTTIAVSDAIAFTGTISQHLWLAVKNHYADDQITFEHGANFVVARADADMLIGRAVLHASDVMEGEDKDPDEGAGVAHVPCSDVALEWSEHTDASVAGTGTYYFARHGSSLLLHRAPKDGASGVTVTAPSCSGEGCMFFEGVATKSGWIELAAVNEGVAAVGWVRAGSVKRVPDSEGVGYTYGCTGDHDLGTMLRIMAPNQQTHDVQLALGTGLFTAPRGEAWAIVKQPATFEVSYAPGDTWAEVTGIPGV